MVRYSFPVGLFHSLLHAGLSRRTRTTLVPSTIRSPGQRRGKYIDRALDNLPPIRLEIVISDARFTAKPICRIQAAERHLEA